MIDWELVGIILYGVVTIGFIFGDGMIYPHYLKRKIIKAGNKNIVFYSSYYFFKISVKAYVEELLFGIFTGAMSSFIIYCSIGFHSKYHVSDYIFIIIFTLYFIITCIISLVKILFLHPRTFVEYEDGILKYNNGRKEVSFKVEDIASIKFACYSKTFYFYLVITVKGLKKKIPVHILDFTNREQLYSLLTISQRRKNFTPS